MNLFSYLLFLFLTIECIQSKQKPIRTYVIYRDNKVKTTQLSSYTIKDGNKKNILYKLKSTSSRDIDTVVLINQPQKDIIANIEGEWVEEKFNVTYSIYDKKFNKWVDGTIQKKYGTNNLYATQWQSNYFETKFRWFSKIMEVYHLTKKEVYAEIRTRKPWFTSTRFEVKIYSDQCPDALYFFLTVINDHRVQMANMD